jgi:hypothetical protein
MAATDFGTLDLYAGLTEDFPFTASLFESDGVTAAALASGDIVHCVLSERTKGEPSAVLLDIPSDDDTPNDSRVFITSLGNAGTGAPAVGYVRFAQADTAAIVAAWTGGVLSKYLVCELYYIDLSEAEPTDAKKLFLRGVIHLHRSGALG